MVCLRNKETILLFLRFHPSTAFWTLLLTESFFFFFSFVKKNYCGMLIYSVVFQMYSKVNQLCIYIYPLFIRFFSHIGHYRVLSRVPPPYSRPLLVICFILCSVYINPNLPIYPSTSSPLVTTSLFSICVTLLLFGS